MSRYETRALGGGDFATPLHLEEVFANARAFADAHGLSVRAEGVLEPGPCVLFANHPSDLDPIAILSVLPCAPIAREEMRAWPHVGPRLEENGALFVDRGSTESGVRVLRGARRALERGVSVLAFPEGTTSSGELLPFQRGVFGLARRLRVPLVPVAIAYDRRGLARVSDETFLPRSLRVWPETRVHLTFGAPIFAPEDEPLGGLVSRARDALARLLEPRGLPTDAARRS